MKKIGKFLLLIIIAFILVRGGIYLYLKSTPKLEIGSVNNILLYDKSNNLYFQGNKTKSWTDLEDISKNVINATIYTEDKHFFSHHGFDYSRIAKASLVNITTHSTSQGASTITQQYAKNLFLDFDKTWERKWQEMWYTMRIEKDYSKNEILEGYLNTINYGHGMYGIENASQFYFNKSAKDLDLAEATLISGIPKSPSNYSPLVDYDTAKERQKLVLDTLENNGIITEEENDEAYNEKLDIIGEIKDNDNSTYMYFHDAVMNELNSLSSIPKSLTDTKGLKIYTTLDVDNQKKLEDNIKTNIPDESTIQTAVVMMRPNDGAIISLVGGRDYNKSSYNRAISAKRQVGSSMKPYLYYAALENGFTSSTSFTSEETTFNLANNQSYSPKNNNNVYGNKPISMATAIAYSENIYAVKTHLFLGENALINTARKVGITSNLQKVPSLPLGTNEIGVMEMARGYAAFANLGYKVTPHLIRRIEDKDGNVLYEYKDNRKLVLDKSLCFILNNMLTATYDKDYVDYNYPTALGIASKISHTYSLKSGTTNTDNWDIGFNKDILTTVWVGYDDNTHIKSSEYKYAQNIWVNAMEGYMEGKEDNWYQVPDNVSTVIVEPISGNLAKEADQKKKPMYFIKGTEPSEDNAVFDEKLGNTTAS